MNDKELLELSAKACGLQEYGFMGGGFMHVVDNTFVEWNPLTDDGDALRLVVKLILHVDANRDDCTVFVHQAYHKKIKFGNDEHDKPIKCFMIVEKYGDDPYSATRLAIVRASAEIGRLMK